MEQSVESNGITSARIVIDSRKLGDGGIGVYTKNLIDGLVELKRSGELVAEIVLLCEPSDAESWESHWGNTIDVVEEAAAKYSLSEYFLMSRRQKKLFEKSHLFHSPHYTLPFSLSVPSVVTIHDVIHVTHPQTFFHRVLGKALIASAVKRAAAILTVSEYSARQIRKLFSCDTQIRVTANAAQSEIKAIDLPQQSQRKGQQKGQQENKQSFCLFVGNSKPHKRLDQLLEAWALLSETSGLEIPSLVVVSTQVSEQQESKIEAASNVMLLKECPVVELNRLYNSALALLMPSTEEGFGLPVLEASLCKTAIVSTPLESVKEYFGDSVWYSEDYSAASFAEAVRQMLVGTESREQKIVAGHVKALSFSKIETARATACCYQEVLNSVYQKNLAPRVFRHPIEKPLEDASSVSSVSVSSIKRVGE